MMYGDLCWLIEYDHEVFVRCVDSISITRAKDGRGYFRLKSIHKRYYSKNPAVYHDQKSHLFPRDVELHSTKANETKTNMKYQSRRLDTTPMEPSLIGIGAGTNVVVGAKPVVKGVSATGVIPANAGS